MRSEWVEMKLSKIMDIVGGGTPKTDVPEYWGGDIPWIAVKDFNNDKRFIYATERTITQLGLDNSSTKLLDKGDLVISARGTVGAIAQLSRTMAFNQTSYGLKAKSDIAINDFLYYLLLNITSKIKSNTHGTVFDTITRKTFDVLSANIPPIEVQNAIVKTLDCIDKKIELNNKINENLEQQAQAIFKSWFVDFEPFQDGKFVESELGMIPEGWEVRTIGDLGEVVGGSTPSKKKPEYYTNNGIPWLTPRDLSTNGNKFVSKGEIDITDLGFENSSVRKMPKGTVLFSSRAPIGYIAIVQNEITTNQGFKSVIPKINIGTEYVYFFLKNNVKTIEARASGSTFKEVSGRTMTQTPALIPNKQVLTDFSHLLRPHFKQQELLEAENEVLLNLRDTLLPKLMSGEIEVPVE